MSRTVSLFALIATLFAGYVAADLPEGGRPASVQVVRKDW